MSEWDAFARVHLAFASQLELSQRRERVEQVLLGIAHDLEAAPAASHATVPATVGLSAIDVVSELCGLRASILRLWSETPRHFGGEQLEEMARFSEAFDRLLVASLASWFQDAQQSYDHLLTALGHDLRNPLGAIIMSATLLLTDDDAGPAGAIAARILRSGKRMDALIGDLIDHSGTGRKLWRP